MYDRAERKSFEQQKLCTVNERPLSNSADVIALSVQITGRVRVCAGTQTATKVLRRADVHSMLLLFG